MEKGVRRNVVDSANKIVSDKETRDFSDLIQAHEIAMAQGDEETARLLQSVAQNEADRLKPTGTFDHEEAKLGVNLYRTGRADKKMPSLGRLKGKGWLKTGTDGKE